MSDPVPENKLLTKIKEAINYTSAENGSNTPDFILAEYLVNCLAVFENASRARERWYDMHCEPGGVRRSGVDKVLAGALVSDECSERPMRPIVIQDSPPRREVVAVVAEHLSPGDYVLIDQQMVRRPNKDDAPITDQEVPADIKQRVEDHRYPRWSSPPVYPRTVRE